MLGSSQERGEILLEVFEAKRGVWQAQKSYNRLQITKQELWRVQAVYKKAKKKLEEFDHWGWRSA